jgi:hypothetical protein
MWAIWAAKNRRSHGETSMSINQAYGWPWEMATDLIQTNITEKHSKEAR